MITTTLTAPKFREAASNSLSYRLYMQLASLPFLIALDIPGFGELA